MEWYLMVLKRYAQFSGRSRRKEYWMFTLINIIISLAIYAVSFATLSHSTVVSGILVVVFFIYSLLVLVPGLAVAVRRLHDIGKSGWMLLIGLIPIVGGIILLIWAASDSQPGDNQYGPNPKSA
jgi:uncharacterized membrane protein YhaH (DUF805 family)